MDFDFTPDQQMLMTAFESLLDGYRQPPQGVHGYVAYSAELQAEVAQAGFLDVAAQPGFGLLEAALLVEAAAACPVSAELAASMLIAPLLGWAEAPLAVAWGLGRPARYLMQARKICLFHQGEAWFVTPEPDAIRAVDSVAAYPLGILDRMSGDATRLDDATAAAVQRRALIGIAAEAAGLMRGALENTVQYVKDREQFGHPLGHFQAIQHRLAECAQLVRAAKWLALRAADSDSDADAATACLYAQDAMRKVITDCHQFSGAMGLTLEFPLHLWTYRLKFLQGEAGGRPQQAQRAARALWPVGSRIEIAV
jgi:alkylation response protein AidB-like acyl-CoA dehydrogenase